MGSLLQPEQPRRIVAIVIPFKRENEGDDPNKSISVQSTSQPITLQELFAMDLDEEDDVFAPPENAAGNAVLEEVIPANEDRNENNEETSLSISYSDSDQFVISQGIFYISEDDQEQHFLTYDSRFDGIICMYFSFFGYI